jgi:HAD superfamily hydrolase (TIGR01509 family)
MSDLYGMIFDVDGVIADTEAVNAAVSIRVFADLFGVEGVKRADFEAGLGRGAEAYLRAAAEVHDVELSAEQVAAGTRARQDYFLAELEANPLPAFPGVMELMQAALQADDFKVAIATSSTREKSEAVLKSARVPYDRMAYVTGSDVKHKKPHPELFQIASQRLELAGRNCLVIEDAPNGIEAAHAAGCRCVGVANSAPADRLHMADRVVASLEELTLTDVRDLIVNP